MTCVGDMWAFPLIPPFTLYFLLLSTAWDPCAHYLLLSTLLCTLSYEMLVYYHLTVYLTPLSSYFLWEWAELPVKDSQTCAHWRFFSQLFFSNAFTYLTLMSNKFFFIFNSRGLIFLNNLYYWKNELREIF